MDINMIHVTHMVPCAGRLLFSGQRWASWLRAPYSTSFQISSLGVLTRFRTWWSRFPSLGANCSQKWHTFLKLPPPRFDLVLQGKTTMGMISSLAVSSSSDSKRAFAIVESSPPNMTGATKVGNEGGSIPYMSYIGSSPHIVVAPASHTG